MSQLLQASTGRDALRRFFYYYTQTLGVGVAMLNTGSTRAKIGNGKTMTNCNFAELLDVQHEDYNVAYYNYTPKTFVDAIAMARGPDPDAKEPKEPYHFIVLDEGEIAANNRAWFLASQQAVVYSFMTFRNLKCIVDISAPLASMIDANIRKLCGFRVVPRLVDGESPISHYRGKQVKAAFYTHMTDFDGDKLYHPHAIYYDPVKDWVRKPRYWWFKKGDWAFIDEVYEKDWKFKHGLGLKISEGLLKLENQVGVRDGVNLKTAGETFMRMPAVSKTLAKKGKISSLLLLAIVRNMDDKDPVYPLLKDLSDQDARKITKAINLTYSGEYTALGAIRPVTEVATNA